MREKGRLLVVAVVLAVAAVAVALGRLRVRGVRLLGRHVALAVLVAAERALALALAALGAAEALLLALQAAVEVRALVAVVLRLLAGEHVGERVKGILTSCQSPVRFQACLSA